jgi:hypothetical protein
VHKDCPLEKVVIVRKKDGTEKELALTTEEKE